ncbi:hypothetical protein AB0H34_47820 [Saccharopolyspora shandongensis]|uniref:hypothetical protein n=1 Tax=Saccharopolyspora shandongensis TaxID=418495 RepID=UPI0033C85C46
MTTPDQKADVTAAMHEVLLRQAGFAPDELVTQARAWLADDRLDEVARAVASTATRYVLPLTEGDLGVLATVFETEGASLDVLQGIEPVIDDPPLVWQFSAEPPDSGGSNDDSVVAALIEVLSGEPAAHGMWRAWRMSPDGAPYPPPRAVYVVEADDDDLPALTARLQQALIAAGEAAPQVEVTPVVGPVPTYQRAARAYGALLWAATETPEITVARVFDAVDPISGPSFAPDHPRMDNEAERGQILDYLRAGAALMITTATLDDVVDPSRGAVVPMSLRTDGTWIWPDTIAYYLEHHHLAPDPDLLAHIRDAGLLPPELDAVAIYRAMDALRRPPEAEPVWTR